MSKINVICDVCGKEFKIKRLEEKKVNIECIELYIQYFKCKKCNKIYIVTISNDKLQEDIDAYKKLLKQKEDYVSYIQKNKISMNKDIIFYLDCLQRNVDGLKNSIMCEQNNLKHKYYEKIKMFL